MKRLIKKVVSVILLIITIILNLENTILAITPIKEATILDKGDCELHLQYNKNGQWLYVTTTYTVYEKDGIEYPVYCLNREKSGVGAVPSYTVSINELLEDDRIWRVLTNGYPYKTPEEMGVYDKYDAFVATKQAIYSILYNNDIKSYYRGADERGTAILNAIENMVNARKIRKRNTARHYYNCTKVGRFSRRRRLLYTNLRGKT